MDEVVDPAGNIIQRAIPSGPQALLHALRAAFGQAEQLQATKALETFWRRSSSFVVQGSPSANGLFNGSSTWKKLY